MSARTKRWWLFEAESMRCPRTCFALQPPSSKGVAAALGSMRDNERVAPGSNLRSRATAGASDGASDEASSMCSCNMIPMLLDLQIGGLRNASIGRGDGHGLRRLHLG